MKTRRNRWFPRLAAIALLVAVAAGSVASAPAEARIEGRTVDQAPAIQGNVPGAHLGTDSDAEIWRALRQGLRGKVSIPDKQAGVMIQSEGDNWRAWRNGPMTVFGARGVLGIIGVLTLFFIVRGRIRIEAGPSGQTVERFNGIERLVHWVTAVSFVVLSLTGLNLLYGKHILSPVLGEGAFAALSLAGKYAHNYLSFVFMAGVVWMFVLWVRHNLPSRHDLVWLAKGGGMFGKGVHPSAKKFNAGQKIIFWAVVLGGLSLTMSGIPLLFPFQVPVFGVTFEALNAIGFDLPASITPMQEMQLSQLWHALVGLIMTIIIIAHIYIGSVGMEGAFDAMGTGRVDANWAREHHDLWYADLKTPPAK